MKRGNAEMTITCLVINIYRWITKSKMKNIKILFFFIMFFFLQSSSIEKHVIGARNAGFFSNFVSVLMHLIGCKKNGLVPVVYWDHYIPYYVDNGSQYNNVWEYYFEPVSNLRFEKSDKINRGYTLPGVPFVHYHMPRYKRNFAYEFRKTMYNVIREYVKVKRHILRKIESFYEKYIKGKKTIGVHFRGTNKILECPRIDVDVFLKVIDKYKDHQIFIASDEYSVVGQFEKAFPGRVIYYNAHRSSDFSPHYMERDKKDPLNATIGEEILIEVMLLSRCDVFLHSVTNVAVAVLFFNPNLKHVFLDPFQKFKNYSEPQKIDT